MQMHLPVSAAAVVVVVVDVVGVLVVVVVVVIVGVVVVIDVVAVVVITFFHYIHIEKNSLPTGRHVFSPIWTIFELVQDINKSTAFRACRTHQGATTYEVSKLYVDMATDGWKDGQTEGWKDGQTTPINIPPPMAGDNNKH
ncbi:hypothetical protein DPMN_019194 [Dreissena polymorpha]|uniref:Uncharacterized protein n=1 Tax=Dreissena polymorpha TaxID=45954 RepID=A0A9D4S730_DREPO|nr:hypothetical protein DPMN_019194 [Dreissena polymorpha]